jgi:hypothetical protein
VGCSDADASHRFVLGYLLLDRHASSLLLVSLLLYQFLLQVLTTKIFDYGLQSICLAMMIVMAETRDCTWVASPLVQGQGTLKTFSANMGGEQAGSKSQVSSVFHLNKTTSL